MSEGFALLRLRSMREREPLPYLFPLHYYLLTINYSLFTIYSSPRPYDRRTNSPVGEGSPLPQQKVGQ